MTLHTKSLLTLATLVVPVLMMGGCKTNSMIRADGYAAMRKGEPAEAKQHFERAAERVPEDFKAQYYLGVTELELGHPHEAQLALERAMVLKPASARWTAALNDKYAEALYQRGASPELFAFLRQAADEEATPGAYLRLGDYYEKSGDPDAAIAAYEQAASMSGPGDARAYLRLAKVYEQARDPERAGEYLGYAYYIQPDEPSLRGRFERLGKVFGPTLKRQPPAGE